MRIVANDLISNDWRTLFDQFATLKAEQPLMRDVTCHCAAGSYRERLVEDRSIHIVLSFSALHYPERLPFLQDESLGGAMSYVSLPKGTEKRQQLEGYMDDMLVDFLTARMAELAPGGRVVCVMDGESESQNHQFAHLYVPLERAIKSMVKDELLPAEVPPFHIIYMCFFFFFFSFLSIFHRLLQVRTTFFIMTAAFTAARAVAAVQRTPQCVQAGLKSVVGGPPVCSRRPQVCSRRPPVCSRRASSLSVCLSVVPRPPTQS